MWRYFMLPQAVSLMNFFLKFAATTLLHVVVSCTITYNNWNGLLLTILL